MALSTYHIINTRRNDLYIFHTIQLFPFYISVNPVQYVLKCSHLYKIFDCKQRLVLNYFFVEYIKINLIQIEITL